MFRVVEVAFYAASQHNAKKCVSLPSFFFFLERYRESHACEWPALGEKAGVCNTILCIRLSYKLVWAGRCNLPGFLRGRLFFI